jgi:ribosomal protein S18 acetylase RimI-like enzyme
MNIRKAAPEDVAEIHKLGEKVSEFSVNDETVTFWPIDLLKRAITSDDALVLVADEDGIQGFLIVNYNHSLRKALIENIYVLPAWRGHYIGDQLVRHMLKILPGMGCEYVATLVPLDAQSAINLYERCGFDRGESFLWLDISMTAAFKKQRSSD